MVTSNDATRADYVFFYILGQTSQSLVLKEKKNWEAHILTYPTSSTPRTLWQGWEEPHRCLEHLLHMFMLQVVQ